MPAGRPTDYTLELADKICEGIASGLSLVKICEDDGMPEVRSIYRWRRLHEEFSQNYALAREDAADFFVQEIMEIADGAETDTVQVAKLRVDTRKWTASRFNRAYIDRSATDTTLKGHLTDLTEEALNRQLENLRNEQAAEDSRNSDTGSAEDSTA